MADTDGGTQYYYAYLGGGARGDFAGEAQSPFAYLVGGARDDSAGGRHILTLSPDKVRVSPRSLCAIPISSKTTVVP